MLHCISESSCKAAIYLNRKIVFGFCKSFNIFKFTRLMSTKINSFPSGNIGNATIVKLPANTDVNVSAVSHAASKQGIYFQFEFSSAPDDFGYEAQGGGAVIIPSMNIKTGKVDEGAGNIQVYVWAVDGEKGYNGGSKVSVVKTANSITLNSEDSSDNDYNDSVLVFSW